MQQPRRGGEAEARITEAANAVAEAFDARVFAYSGAIDGEGFGSLVKAMQVSDQQPYRPNSVLLLTTQGGFADPAYQIARLLQDTSDEFTVVLPARCKSAGTLIALGATKLVMTSVSELGPLDVQLAERDEIGKRRSGLVVRTALAGLSDEAFAVFERVMIGIKVKSGQAVSFEVASEIAAQIAVGVMAPVYAQISPDALGNDLRDLHIATEYGSRLVAHGKNANQETVHQLVEGYPAHGFIIDKAETETLFNTVEEPDEKIGELIFAAGKFVYGEQEPHYVKRLDYIRESEDDGDTGNERETKRSSKVDDGRPKPRRRNPKGERTPD